MTSIELSSGVRLFAQDLGAGPVVVFVAGFGLAHDVWDRQVRELSRFHRVICVDQRGHGDSDKPLSGYAVTELAGDLIAALRILGVGDCTLVGWSFGGQVAFRAAAEAPDLVSRLVLVGSNGVRASRSTEFPFGRDAAPMIAALVDAEMQDRLAARRAAIVSGFHGKPDPTLVDWLVGISMRMPSWATVACYEAMLNADLIADLPRVTQPVLQLIGAADPVHSAKGARWLCDELADACLVELPDCGHYPMFEVGDAFSDALTQFLTSC